MAQFFKPNTDYRWRMAQSLMGKQKPIRHWSDGVSNATNTIASALMAKKADEADTTRMNEQNASIAAMLKSPNGLNPSGLAAAGFPEVAMTNALSQQQAESNKLGTTRQTPKMIDDVPHTITETYAGNGVWNASDPIPNWRPREEKDNLPSGMQMVDGVPQYIPGYIEGQKQIFEARSLAGQDNWQTDPDNPTIQVNLTTGEEKLAPQTETEKAEERAVIEAATEAEKNKTVFNAFDVGMKNLDSAMDETETGPLVGRLPTFTAKQQTAEGAVSVMAPVLKSMFRSAGEGVFTDKDQDLLMGMIPTRQDHPEARKAKTDMIYSIVRAKLGMPDENGGANLHTASGQNGGSVPDVSQMSDEELWKLAQ